MNPKLVFVCVTVLQSLGQSKSHIECQTSSATGKDQPDENLDDRICDCCLDAKLMNTMNPTSEETVKNKRDIVPARTFSTPFTVPEPTMEKTNLVEDISLTTTAPGHEGVELDLNPEKVVGHPAPKRLSLTTVRRQQSRAITAEQQRLIIQQIHARLRRLTYITDERLREIEMGAIRADLKRLAQTHVAETPQLRSRIRTIRHRRRRPQRFHLVGAGAPQYNEMNPTTGEPEVLMDKKSEFEIITQDPKLVDE